MKYNLGLIVIGIAFLFGTLIIGNAVKNRNTADDVISVTGLGKKDFEADLIVWQGSFAKVNMELQDAYAELDADRTVIQKYLVSKGLTEDEIVFSAVNITKEYDYTYDNNYNMRNQVFKGYRLNQEVKIESNEVDKVEEISRQVTELINQGLEFYSYPPNYYYTKLAELKIEMVASATADATARAERIAENANATLGDLKNARMGVFQIIAQNSNEDYSWGGAYNTTSKEKTATITMKLDFNIN